MKNKIPKLRFPEFNNNWVSESLGATAKFLKGKGISKSDISENGKFECIRYGELYTDYNELIIDIKSRTNLNQNQLILSESNDVIIPASGETHIDIATASCVLKKGVALGGDLNIIKSKNDGVFLAYYLNNKKRIDIARLAQGNSVVHLYSSQLKSLNLLLPKIEEQQKIASFLTAVDDKIQQLTKKKELLEKYKKGVMQKIFPSTSSGQVPEIRFKNDYGNDYPDWEKMRLSKIANISKGTQVNKNTLTETGKHPVMNGGIFPSGYSEEYNRESNVIAISEGGNSCGFVNYMKEKFWSGGHNYTLENIIADINKVYVYHFLKHNEIFIMRLRVGSGLPNIQKSSIGKFIIKFPKSSSEQTKIADFLSSIDNKIDSVNTQVEKTKEFKKGLLQQMFV